MKFPRHPDRIVAGAFTLIELLVVISIIAVLIGILLPALSAARKHGQAVKCATNLHHVSQAMGGYLADNGGVYPPSYVYCSDADGNYDLNEQLSSDNAPYGYLHWSYFLYAGKNTPQESFQCPTIPNGGLPRTNPGPEGWEPGQTDGSGNSGPSSGAIEDRQAVRMAYTGNAAIFPRNKFQLGMSTGGSSRVNVCVNEKSIDDPARVVLATEFNKNWKLVAQGSGDSGLLSKSHRPINAMMHPTSPNEYDAPDGPPGFTYGNGANNFGLQSESLVSAARDILAGGGYSQANAVGRHHPGGDKLGGTANFLYADGHVDRKTVRQTLERWEWGRRYYSLTGYNKIGPPWN